MVWGASAGLIGGLKRNKVDEKGSLAEAIRVLESEAGKIRRTLEKGLRDMVDVMSQWMEDHQPKVLEEEWQLENEVEVIEDVKGLVEEKEVFRESI